jgi:predicted nucleotidyltransferase
MPIAHKSTTIDMSLAEVVEHLRLHQAVAGVLAVGSTGRGELNPSSDYDIVVILAEMPVPLHVGVTNIAGRFADIIFHTTAQVDTFLEANQPFGFWHWTGRLIGWLQESKILFDRNGRVHQAQEKAQTGEWLAPSGMERGVKAWNGVNYNLLVLRRYLASDDPLYLATADLRMMIYGPADLFFNYFEARCLRWNGEKQAIHYLQQHDPGYLSLFNQFLIEGDRNVRFRLYEALAERTLAPIGPLWRTTDTVMMVDAEEVTSAMEKAALDFWNDLVGGNE